jgi:PhnB protein
MSFQMKANPIPAKYNRVMPYISVANASAFVEFAQVIFGANEMSRQGPPGGPVVHGELKIGDSVLMYCDAAGDDEPDSICLMVYVEDCDSVYHQALAAGAKSRSEPTNQFYGDRIAKIQDPCGIHWAISSRLEDLTDEEIRKRARAIP